MCFLFTVLSRCQKSYPFPFLCFIFPTQLFFLKRQTCSLLLAFSHVHFIRAYYTLCKINSLTRRFQWMNAWKTDPLLSRSIATGASPSIPFSIPRQDQKGCKIARPKFWQCARREHHDKLESIQDMISNYFIQNEDECSWDKSSLLMIFFLPWSTPKNLITKTESSLNLIVGSLLVRRLDIFLALFSTFQSLSIPLFPFLFGLVMFLLIQPPSRDLKDDYTSQKSSSDSVASS